jgi:cation diffusion facilitator family transporter
MRPVDSANWRRAERAAKASLAATCAVVAVKLAAGVASGSVSVLAEALQSGVDVLIAIGVVATIRYAALPPDEDHPYGHGKAELLMSVAQTQLVLLTAGFILFKAYQRFLDPRPVAVDVGVAAMAFAAASNALLSAYLLREAKATGSTVLRTEVLHLRSDTLAALGILTGLVAMGATGWLWLDPLAATIFTLAVVAMAARRLWELKHPLMDGALPREQIAKLRRVLDEHPEVRSYHALRTRSLGAARRVELHVQLDDGLSFVEAHERAEEIEDALSQALGGAVVEVHYEPFAAEAAHQRERHGPAGEGR